MSLPLSQEFQSGLPHPHPRQIALISLRIRTVRREFSGAPTTWSTQRAGPLPCALPSSLLLPRTCLHSWLSPAPSLVLWMLSPLFSLRTQLQRSHFLQCPSFERDTLLVSVQTIRRFILSLGSTSRPITFGQGREPSYNSSQGGPHRAGDEIKQLPQEEKVLMRTQHIGYLL